MLEVAREAIFASTGVQMLIGLSGIILGILALVGLSPLVLTLVALPSLGTSVLVSSSAISSTFFGWQYR